ncbi:MAG TPA: SecD/SecF family protein translocase subunit [Hyphomonas sp.]|nr:SecD/SecF family protein translocase subunit [Hyphomonas sp.]
MANAGVAVFSASFSALAKNRTRSHRAAPGSSDAPSSSGVPRVESPRRALVVVLMLLVYGLFGIFANIALILNLIIIVGIMTALQSTLTLPGIAGIVLTMGMAVDANVLIFERMREEVAQGRSVISAVDAGYNRAMSAIIDANLTTLLAVLILFQLGSGPVRGFAVTLGIGITVSMFTAIMVTRLFVIYWLWGRKPKALPI